MALYITLWLPKDHCAAIKVNNNFQSILCGLQIRAKMLPAVMGNKSGVTIYKEYFYITV